MRASSASRPSVDVFLGLGANLGDAPRTVQQAIAAIAQWPQSELAAASSLYRTAPVDATGPDYINAVVHVRTGLSPQTLLAACRALEQAAGRERPYRNAPRTLDVDVLLYGDAQICTPELTVPHPRMAQRAFVLVPLAEIAPELVGVEQLRAVADQAISKSPAPLSKLVRK